MLEQLPNPFVKEVAIKPADLIKEPEILKFFMEDIDSILDAYEPGNLENKPDVQKEIKLIKDRRERMMQEQREIQMNQQNSINTQVLHQKLSEQSYIIQQLSLENKQLHEKIKYLESTITKLIQDKIQEKKKI